MFTKNERQIGILKPGLNIPGAEELGKNRIPVGVSLAGDHPDDRSASDRVYDHPEGSGQRFSCWSDQGIEEGGAEKLTFSSALVYFKYTKIRGSINHLRGYL